jgi:hypothetical protein
MSTTTSSPCNTWLLTTLPTTTAMGQRRPVQAETEVLPPDTHLPYVNFDDFYIINFEIMPFSPKP